MRWLAACLGAWFAQCAFAQGGAPPAAAPDAGLPQPTLVRAAVTASIGRNQEPRRPLDTLQLPSAVFYHVEADGFRPRENYQVRVVVLDGAQKTVVERYFGTVPEASRHVVWTPVTPSAADAPGRWTFRMYFGSRQPASQLVAETTIDAGTQAARAEQATLERFWPALVVAVLGLLAYVAYQMRVHARTTPASPPAPGGRSIAALAVLVLVNLLPLGLVYFAGVNAADLLVIYWCENLVIAFYAVLRMVSARGQGQQEKGAWTSIPLFLLHFGLFCGGHGAAVLHYAWRHSTFAALDPQTALDAPIAAKFAAQGWELWDVVPFVLVLQVALLFISHGISFVQNYLKGGEYLAATAGEEAGRPYRRVVAMHLAGGVSGGFALAQGSPLPMLVLFVLLKTGTDLFSHLGAHRARGARPG